MHDGSCLCGKVKYRITCEPKKVSHCHCTMCQNHLAGQELLSTYRSFSTVHRKFCSYCESNIEWSGSPEYPEWTSIAIATLDTPYDPENIINIYIETKVFWLGQS